MQHSWRIITLDFGTRCTVEGLAFRKKRACASRILKMTSKHLLPSSLVTSYFCGSTHYNLYICINENKCLADIISPTPNLTDNMRVYRHKFTNVNVHRFCMSTTIYHRYFYWISISVILVHVDGTCHCCTSNQAMSSSSLRGNDCTRSEENFSTRNKLNISDGIQKSVNIYIYNISWW